MPAWVREKAQISMTSPLGGPELIPIFVNYQEQISSPFTMQIRILKQESPLAADDLLYKPVCVTLRDVSTADAPPVRYFHGLVHSIESEGEVRTDAASGSRANYKYLLTVVPRLWFLNQTHDCRVYQEKSSKDIITAVFQDAGLTDVTWEQTGSAPARPYTVQFNETDYNFVCRLMEEEGWYYYFEHTSAKHQLHILNANAAFKDIPNATLRHAAADADTKEILEWHASSATATGSFKMRDYDPENPATKLMNEQKTVFKADGKAARDVFRWPALTKTASVVEGRAKFEIEAAEAAASLCRGRSRFGAIAAGGKFKLECTPASPDDGTYVVRSSTHQIYDDSWISGGGTTSYVNEFEAFKVAQAWREPITTPRPRMEGIHTAIVMGPQSDAGADIKMQDGEEIHTDDLARVKVRFFWDHRAEATGGASIWARVVQPWAGNGWGAQFLPRVGTEVAVGFVDGDPDRPIVLGGLYNGVSTPIYSKADKTKSGFRTRSTLKGEAAKFNELTFDDKKGNEKIFIHAEKDMLTEVENDQTLKVDNCRIVEIKVDETVTIKGKQTVTVKGDHKFEVQEGNSDNKITKGNHTLKIGMGNHAMQVEKGNHDLKVDMGNITVKAGLGAISMEAMQSITLKVGSSTIKIDQMGITIKGAMKLEMEGGMTTALKAGLKMDVDGGLMFALKSSLMTKLGDSELMTSVKGGVMTTLKGAIMMIN